MTAFWRNWLTIWAWGVIVFGAALAGAGFAASDGVAMALLDIMGPMPAAIDSAHRFAIGLMGAVTMGWGMTFLAFFQLSDAAPPAPAAWRTMAIGFAIWYLIDSAISIHTGFALNAVSNTALLILLLIPLFSAGVFSTERPLRAA